MDRAVEGILEGLQDLSAVLKQCDLRSEHKRILAEKVAIILERAVALSTQPRKTTVAAAVREE